ncbi:hypothetical protein LUZ60_007105 [Juncus effusus]|nr:hypothetical protein LUZ60_007105 [Juncus effusus]
MQHHQGDYSSSYPNPYTSYPNPNPNPMEYAPPAPAAPQTPIQPSYASAPPYTPYPPEFPSEPSFSYPQSNQSTQFQSQSTQFQSPSTQFGQPQSTQFQPQSTQFQPQLNNYNQPQSSQLPSYPPYNPSQYQPEPTQSPSPGQYYANFSPNPSPYPSIDSQYESNPSNRYGPTVPTFDSDLYVKKPYEEGVFAYDGGRNEPYGARGIMGNTRSNSISNSNSNSSALFDDYGRSISLQKTESGTRGTGTKIVKAVPKMDTQTDVKSGVQKFRVKLLAEGAGSNTDVLCQVGLDGIKMLDPSTSRTLRIYPLETLTRWEVLDSSIFAFWSKTSVDIESRRIRLKSNSYTTNTILDTVTAATVQFKEMGGGNLSRTRSIPEASKIGDQSNEKKKGIIDWVNFIKPPNEEKEHWVPDEAVTKCTACGADFGAFVRRHHCRNCGDIFCDKCTQGRIALTAEDQLPVRVCDRCMAEVTQRLSNAKEAANRPVVHSHESLAKKLQEEMERNRKSSSASKSDSGRRMREVACPVCTVHLQVQVPTSGSETIECGVCQHPFLVSAH